MRWLRFVLVFGILTVAASHTAHRPDAAPTADIKLQRIHYLDLAAQVKLLKGQVVVVDFWADYCEPCKREFSKLVALQRQFGARGLAVVTVSLDDADDAEVTKNVHEFLLRQQATSVNYILHEKPEVWQAKLKVQGPPCVFVFDRSGELLHVYRGSVDYVAIEKAVAAALKE